MPNSVFVGREAELRQLKSFLDSAATGKAQVVFIAGEAGAGKSSLIGEFVRRAEETDPKLISSTGECNAQTGMADPYLPFRQVLTALTTGNETGKSPKEAGQAKKVSRWKEFVQVSSKTLIMLGPDLVGIFVPGASLLTRIGTTIALNSNLAAKLSEQVGKKSGKEAPKIDPALDQEKIFEQYTAVLKTLAKDHTLVLVLDDLQWADSGSINLFFYLARQLKDSRVLLVGAYRPDDVALGREGVRHPLESVLNELKRYNGDIVIDLAQTAASEGRAFVDALVDAEPNCLESSFRDELFAHTGGHPLFTVELLRNLEECGNLTKDAQGSWVQANQIDWETLPARIEGVIGERIARLPADLHETLTVGSVVGQEFAAQVVGSVQKVNERELVRSLSRDLEKRYMLVVELGEIKIGRQFLSQYRFSNVLLQQYLYDELSSGERRMLHGEIAETLETLYADQKDQIALQLARHYEAAGEDEKAIAYLIIAGDSAFGVYAYPEAVSAYTRALESGEQAATGAQQLSHIYLRRGRALELSSQFELAAKVASCTLYSTATPVADAGKAQMLAEETLLLAKALGDRPSEAKVLWNLQLVNLLQNKALEAIGYGEKSLSIARELNLREQMAYVLSDLGWAYNVACQFDQAKESIEEGASLWRELGNLPMLSNNLILSLFGLFWAGKNAEVLHVAEESYQLSVSIKEVWNQALARNFQGLVQIDYGEIDQGLATLEESVRLAAQGNPVYELWYGAILLQVYGELGAADLVMDRYRTLRVVNRDGPHTPERAGTLIAYAMYELTSGQLEAATNTLNECKPDAIPWETLFHIAKGRLALARADFTEALALAGSAVDLARQYKLGHYLAEALFLKGKTHFDQGDKVQAKNALEQARSAAEKLGSRYLLWQIIALLAEVETDKELSLKLKTEARQIVDYIAGHITRSDLRQAFLRSVTIYALSGEK